MSTIRFTTAIPPRVDVHHVPGLAPFATVEFIDTEGSTITLELWQPATATEIAHALSIAGYRLAQEMAAPAPVEG